MTSKTFSTLPALKFDLSDHPFIKYDIFQVAVNFPPRGIPVGIVAQYGEHHNMSYTYRETNKRPWNRAYPERNETTL